MKKPSTGRASRTFSTLLRSKEGKKYPVKKPGISGLLSGANSTASPLGVLSGKKDYSKNKGPDQEFILPERIERGS